MKNAVDIQQVVDTERSSTSRMNKGWVHILLENYLKPQWLSAPNFTSMSSTAFRAKQAASGKETEASEKSVRRCIQFSVLQYKKDVKKWEGVQWSATEMMKHLPGQRGCAISILGDFQDTIV